MTNKFLQISRFALPAVAAIAATAIWVTLADNVASGRPGSGDPETSGLAAAILSAQHASAITDTSRAISYLESALAIDPSNTDLLEENYFLAVQMGDFDSAVPSAKKAYELLPRRGLAPVVLAVHHYRRKEYDQAWSYIDGISGQGLNAFALPMLRAWGSAPTRTADESLAELAAMESYRDIEDLSHAMSGLLNEYYGRDQAALEHYDALAFDSEKRRISLVRLIAGGYHRLGQPDKAEELVGRYQNANGPSPTVESFANPRSFSKKMTLNEGMAEALFAGAEMLLRSRATDGLAQLSIAYAQSALHLDPSMIITRRYIGITLAARSHYAESNQILSAAKKSAPGYLEAQMQIAENFTRMEELESALSTLEALSRSHSEWPEVHVAMGDLLRQLQRYPDAVEAYDTALALYPEDRAANWAAYYMRGIALERAKEWNRAEHDFRKALALNPDDAGVMNYLGYSYLDRGENLTEARRLIEKAYEKNPTDGYIIDSLGWAMYVMGEFEEAVVQLERAAESTPADATINDHLGDAYWQVGRINEARFQWERALTLDPDDAQRKAILAKLEQGLAKN
jgi:tetratricopeptide (TPR) repeat protein